MYQKNWTLDIQNMSWVEDINRQVDFLIKQLHLKGTEKILDLACGFGRHSLEFARRGYDVTGIDITSAYIDYAKEQAKKDMESMLDYIDKLNELDTEGVEPMSHVFPVHNVFREDEVTNGDDRENMLKNAPQKKEGTYMVPKTFA